MSAQVKGWLLAFRPKTLTAAVVPIFVGTALVVACGFSVVSWISVCALLSAVLIQIGTNLVNDAVDFKKGADTEKRIGPQRVTQSGVFKGRTVMLAGTICFALAIAFGIPLVWQGGWPIVTIGILSVFCGYAYTAGPFPLAYRGLGDVFVIIFFGLIAVGGLFYLHTGRWPADAVICGLQVGMLATVLIAINNLRDVEGDRLVSKRTLPVRFGKTFARYEIAAMALLPFALNLLWIFKGWYWAGLLPFLILPLAFKLIKNIFTTEPSSVYNGYLAQAAKIQLGFGLLLTVGLLLR